MAVVTNSFQSGWIVEKEGKRGTSYKLCWRQKDADGIWVVRSQTMPKLIDGKPVAKKDALRRLNELVEQVNTGKAPAVKPKSILFKDLVAGPWAAYKRTQAMRPGTADAYTSMLKKWVGPFFDELALADITPQDVGRFMDSLGLAGLSSKYRKNIYGMLSSLFDVALQNDLIAVSPIRPKMHRPKVQKMEKPTMDLGKLPMLLQAVGELGGEVYKLALAALVGTGMRQGELLGLLKSNVDFEAGLLSTTGVLYRGRLLLGTKNTSDDGKVRQQTREMSGELRAVLKRAFEVCPQGDLVFCLTDGSPLDPDHFRNYVLYPAMKQIGMKPELDHTHGFHMFRHTAGSEVFRALGSMKAAQEMLGHSNMQTTANIYVHTDRDQRQAASNVLGKLLQGVA